MPVHNKEIRFCFFQRVGDEYLYSLGIHGAVQLPVSNMLYVELGVRTSTCKRGISNITI